MAAQNSAKHSITLYSNVWTTIIMLVFFLFSGISGTDSVPVDNPGPIAGDNLLAGRTIIIDPGHGGGDPGTIGVSKTTEAENVLAIAWDLRGMLEHSGAKVIMTRQTEKSPAQGTSFAYQTNGQLAARTAISNRSDADIFVSIHNDWNGTKSISGSTTYYYKSQDWLLSDSIQSAITDTLGSRDVGVKRGNFYVLRNTNIPAALVEVGFLSNNREAELLSQPWYRTAAAQGIYQGIVDYYRKSGLI